MTVLPLRDYAQPADPMTRFCAYKLAQADCAILDCPVMPSFAHGNDFEVVGETLKAEGAEALDARVDEYLAAFAKQFAERWADKCVIVLQPPTLRNASRETHSVDFTCLLAVRRRWPGWWRAARKRG